QPGPAPGRGRLRIPRRPPAPELGGGEAHVALARPPVRAAGGPGGLRDGRTRSRALRARRARGCLAAPRRKLRAADRRPAPAALTGPPDAGRASRAASRPDRVTGVRRDSPLTGSR